MSEGRKREWWSVDTTFCETVHHALLIATSVFAGSEFGKNLAQKFKTGDAIRITVEHYDTRHEEVRRG